jgi:hypothetical protein
MPGLERRDKKKIRGGWKERMLSTTRDDGKKDKTKEHFVALDKI